MSREYHEVEEIRFREVDGEDVVTTHTPRSIEGCIPSPLAFRGWPSLALEAGTTIARLKEMQEEARAAKDYATADRIRNIWMPLQDSLSSLGIAYREDVEITPTSQSKA